MISKLLVELELSLKHKLKVRATQQGISIKEYIIFLIENDLKEKKPINLDCSKEGIRIK